MFVFQNLLKRRTTVQWEHNLRLMQVTLLSITTTDQEGIEE